MEEKIKKTLLLYVDGGSVRSRDICVPRTAIYFVAVPRTPLLVALPRAAVAYGGASMGMALRGKMRNDDEAGSPYITG